LRGDLPNQAETGEQDRQQDVCRMFHFVYVT
jgi:hypothetical protein